MGKTDEHADGSPLKMKKKSKENKNMANNPLLVGDGNSHVETEDGHLKKKKKDKHREKKRKSELKEDGETDGDHLNKEKRDKHRKKRKSEPKEDGNEDQHDKGNLKNDDLQKKNKKRKIKDNELDQNAGPDVEKDCPEETFKKIDKKKKKVDGQSLDTEMNRTMTEESAPNVKAKSKSKSKKVRFSGQVEVFPASETQPEKQTSGDGLVRGKRFTPEEDEIVKQAVLDYITAKGLGEEGLKMVLNCKSHKGMKKCWQEIGLCLPYRPHTAVYCRAHVLFERSEDRTWTPEEIKMLKEFHEEHGNNWKKLADEMGKHRFHVKDAWRRYKFENLKAGKWSQEEYQNLYDLVNLDLQIKISSEETKKSKHGMLRDNIPWTAISEKLTTRTDATCCMKWYNQLTSSLVAENKWCDADDYRMIGALYEMDAACVDDVDWDNVLEHRPGDICLKRWNQMVKHIGDYRSKSFGEQVEILAERYAPNLAETREAWDNKPIVP